LGKVDERKSREGPLNIRDPGICRSALVFLGTGGEDVALFHLLVKQVVLAADKGTRKEQSG